VRRKDGCQGVYCGVKSSAEARSNKCCLIQLKEKSIRFLWTARTDLTCPEVNSDMQALLANIAFFEDGARPVSAN
jgi:hypothetical protein